MGAFFGLISILYGVAILLSSVATRWLGVFGVLDVIAVLTACVVPAHTGFSDLAMTMTMPSILLVLLWCICVRIFLLRSAVADDNPA
jgi:hypothetical protein